MTARLRTGAGAWPRPWRGGLAPGSPATPDTPVGDATLAASGAGAPAMPGGGLRRRAAGLAAVAVALVSASCGIGLQQLPTPGGPGGPTYQLHATFANVLDLPIGAKVRVGVAVVGDVSAITVRGFAAHTVLTITKAIRLPVGTTAQVRFESPLGDDFVQLRPPSAPATVHDLGNGAHIPESATTTAPSIEDTLTALAAVLNGSGLQQVQLIISQINDALAGNTGNVQALLDDLDHLTGSLAAHQGDIDAALSAMQALGAQLAAGSGTLAAGIGALTPATEELAADNGALDKLVASVNQVTATATQVVAQSGQQTVRDVQALVPVVTQLVGVDGQLGGDLATLAAFERAFPHATPGDYLQFSLDATVSFPGPPVALGSATRPAGESFLQPGSAGVGTPAAGAVVLDEAALP